METEVQKEKPKAKGEDIKADLRMVFVPIGMWAIVTTILGTREVLSGNVVLGVILALMIKLILFFSFTAARIKNSLIGMFFFAFWVMAFFGDLVATAEGNSYLMRYVSMDDDAKFFLIVLTVFEVGSIVVLSYLYATPADKIEQP